MSSEISRNQAKMRSDHVDNSSSELRKNSEKTSAEYVGNIALIAHLSTNSHTKIVAQELMYEFISRKSPASVVPSPSSPKKVGSLRKAIEKLLGTDKSSKDVSNKKR